MKSFNHLLTLPSLPRHYYRHLPALYSQYILYYMLMWLSSKHIQCGLRILRESGYRQKYRINSAAFITRRP